MSTGVGVLLDKAVSPRWPDEVVEVEQEEEEEGQEPGVEEGPGGGTAAGDQALPELWLWRLLARVVAVTEILESPPFDHGRQSGHVIRSRSSRPCPKSSGS